MADELIFDEARHQYTLYGRPIPSVTQIMKPMSLMLYNGVNASQMHEAASRGTRAHQQVSNLLRFGILEIDEDTEPYVAAFRRWCKQSRFAFLQSEVQTYHRYMRYGGTIDLLGFVNPDNGVGVDLIDIKCTATFHPMMVATQTSAYAEALRSHGIHVRGLYGLHLRRNGTYQLFQLMNEYKTFLHCLGIYNAMNQ